VPLIPEVHDVVERRIAATEGHPDARLFTGPRGGRITTAVLRDATHWDEVVAELDYEHLRRHSLRHTGLTWMADAGAPIHVLRRITGHGWGRVRRSCGATRGRAGSATSPVTCCGWASRLGSERREPAAHPGRGAAGRRALGGAR
jgi:hypothetical protein